MVDAEVIKSPPWVDRRLTAESIVLIFKPDISKSDRGKALIVCFLSERLITEKFFFILLDERGVKYSGLEGIVQ